MAVGMISELLALGCGDPRVNKGRAVNLDGIIIDLAGKDPSSGKPWDLRKESVRQLIKRKLTFEKPQLIIGAVSLVTDEAIDNFHYDLYRAQLSYGRYFIHQQPEGSTYTCARRLRSEVAKGQVRAVRGSVRWDSHINTKLSPHTWFTNSSHIREQLHKLCTVDEVISISQGALKLAVLRGMRRELSGISLRGINGVGTVNEEKSYEDEYADHVKFIDDVTGRPLNPKLVAKARADEVRDANAHNVWTKVPIEECVQRTGKGPIGGRWVDRKR